MPRGDRARATGREMARRSKLCRRLAWHRGRCAQTPGSAGCRGLRKISSDGGEPTGERQAQSAGYLSGLCNARPDDHFDQRSAIYRLQEVRMGRGRRNGLCRFVGAGAEDRRTLAFAALFRRATLWRRAGRGDADGAEARATCQGDRRHEATRQKRLALSHRALWYPERRARRHGRIVWEEVICSETNSGTPSLRGAKRRSNPEHHARFWIVCGVYHQARIRATRWLAMTEN